MNETDEYLFKRLQELEQRVTALERPPIQFDTRKIIITDDMVEAAQNKLWHRGEKWIHKEDMASAIEAALEARDDD